MRIAITNPFCWPQVRRGSERFIEELAAWLTQKGHQVTIIAGAQGPYSNARSGGIRRITLPQRSLPGLGLLRLSSSHIFSFQCRQVLKQTPFDIVHSMSYFDAFGATMAAPSSPAKLLMHIAGIPVRGYFRPIPIDGFFFRHALGKAHKTVVASAAARDSLEKDFGYKQAALVPGAVDLSLFSAADSQRDSTRPRILMAGSLDETRKGARVLAKAFVELKKKIPTARLVYTGQTADATRAAIFALIPEQLHRDVEVLGPGSLQNLPRLYSEASVTALPAIWEAFGMVLIESLASGTPVVGCRHGGIPDIISNEKIGRLFEPGDLTSGESTNHLGLAKALAEAIALNGSADIRLHCRQHAKLFSWDVVGPQFEMIYHEMLRQ